MAVERRKAKVFKVTVEDLYKAACTRSEPCGAHIKTVDQMVKRLERAAGAK